MDIRVPDKIGETRKAWRAWKISMEDGEICLRSINQIDDRSHDSLAVRWQPKEIMVAKHIDKEAQRRVDKHSDEDVPYEGCSCGIHALVSPLFLVKAGYVSFVGPDRQRIIWGEIEMWGKIIEGTTGIKSQFAYPKAFYLRSDVELTIENENGVTKLDAWLIRDALSVQWGVPAIVGRTLKKKERNSIEVRISEYPEPTE